MLLAEPQPTPADWHFEIAGIRIRVSVWFWAAAALLGFGICQQFAAGDQRALLGYLVVWAGAVLVSLLVHELGHALAYRFFGQGAHIVVYHFGGLAIPETAGRRVALRPIQRLAVSAAGPLAQFALAAAVVAALKLGGWFVPFPIVSLGRSLGLYEGAPLESPLLGALVHFLLSVNIFWPLLNLVPVPPLDGGQIVREGLLAAGVADAHRIAGVIGVGVGGVAAWWGYTSGQTYLAILFAMLAVSCWQGLSASGGRWR